MPSFHSFGIFSLFNNFLNIFNNSTDRSITTFIKSIIKLFVPAAVTLLNCRSGFLNSVLQFLPDFHVIHLLHFPRVLYIAVFFVCFPTIYLLLRSIISLSAWNLLPFLFLILYSLALYLTGSG